MADLKGKFVYNKTAKGNFNFRLKASNNETIAVSDQVYENLTRCKAGVESVRKFCNIETIEDQTVKDYEVQKNPKFELYKDKQDKFRYRLRANNGNLLCISEEGYASKASCKNGIKSVGKWAPDAELMSNDEFESQLKK